MKKVNEEKIMRKINKAKECYVWCVMDGQDVGKYFKTTKLEVLNLTKGYIKNNEDLTNLDNCYDFHNESEILYIN